MLFSSISVLSVYKLCSVYKVFQNSKFGYSLTLLLKYVFGVVLIGAPDPRTQAIYYFVSAIAVLLIAFDAYFLLPLTVSWQFYDCFVVIFLFLH